MTNETISQPEEFEPNEQKPRGLSDSEFEDLISPEGRAVLVNLASRFVGNKIDAQDVVQESFIRIIKYRDSYEGSSQPATWAHRITVDMAKNHLDKKRKDRSFSHYLDEFSDKLEDPTTNVELDVEYSAFNEDVANAIASMDEGTDKQILSELQRSGEINHEQLAKRLGITINASKIRKHRAMKKLTGVLEDWYAYATSDTA